MPKWYFPIFCWVSNFENILSYIRMSFCWMSESGQTVFVWDYVCVFVCMCVYVCIYVFVCVYVQTCVYVYASFPMFCSSCNLGTRFRYIRMWFFRISQTGQTIQSVSILVSIFIISNYERAVNNILQPSNDIFRCFVGLKFSRAYFGIFEWDSLESVVEQFMCLLMCASLLYVYICLYICVCLCVTVHMCLWMCKYVHLSNVLLFL